MPTIYLETIIHAPIERVFDLARCIEIHKLSTAKTNEQAIAGRTTGLINLNETVTWRAKHFGIYQQLTVVITQMEPPNLFADQMTKGAFASMHHVHRFERIGSSTKMIDEFNFTAPLGLLGKLANWLFLTKYMKGFLLIRNDLIKQVAEGDDWQKFIHS